MRRILIERARRKSSLKHGGGKERLDIEGLELAETTPDDKVLLVNEALEQLETSEPERARVVVLKYFGGLTNKEVRRPWTSANAAWTGIGCAPRTGCFGKFARKL